MASGAATSPRARSRERTSTPPSSAATSHEARSTAATDAPWAALVRAWLILGAERIVEAAPELTELDARIGDGDHGINLGRGMALVRDRLLADTSLGDPAGELLRRAGRSLVSSVGGASGPLYGTLLLESGDAMLGTGAVTEPLALAEALLRGVSGVGRRGRSTVGQKTMLDTLVPAVDRLRAEVACGRDLPVAAARAAEAAADGCESTRGMVAQRGRASYLGERAIGHLDPGAVSSRLLVEALAEAAAQLPASTSEGVSR
jgi:dihydroxyacetone kinase-like protein